MDSPVVPGRVSHEKFTNPLQARLRQVYLDGVLSNSKEMLFFTKSKERGKKNDISFVIQNLKLSISCIDILVNFKLISTIKLKTRDERETKHSVLQKILCSSIRKSYLFHVKLYFCVKLCGF